MDISNITSFFYETITFETFLKFIVLYFFIIWIAVLLWVIKDISNRTNNTLLQVISILIILFLTPLGILIYLIIRPGKTLFEKYYQEIEDNLNLFNKIIEDKGINITEKTHCHKCDEEVKDDYKFCPKCKETLKNECRECWKFVFINWKVCPYCGIKNKLKKILDKKNTKKVDKKKKSKK